MCMTSFHASLSCRLFPGSGEDVLNYLDVCETGFHRKLSDVTHIGLSDVPWSSILSTLLRLKWEEGTRQAPSTAPGPHLPGPFPTSAQDPFF